MLAEFLLDGSLARTSSLWGRYGICAHARAVDAGQKAISCQSIDKLANPSSLVRAQANIPGSGCTNEFYFVFF